MGKNLLEQYVTERARMSINYDDMQAWSPPTPSTWLITLYIAAMPPLAVRGYFGREAFAPYSGHL